MWGAIQELTLQPLRQVAGDPRASQLLQMVPGFRFDVELLGFELPTHPVDGADALVSVVRTVCGELVTVPQVLGLCRALNVTTLAELKSKLNVTEDSDRQQERRKENRRSGSLKRKTWAEHSLER